MISIIVPVYNTEKYLHRCIDSILAQTFTDFELLLINDGSTDSSGEICGEYAKKDSRVHVFHKENGGVSSARNLGLDNAQGEWITFIDSDDWVSPFYNENLIRHSTGHVDLVISFSVSIFKNKRGQSNYESKLIDKCNYELLFTVYDLSWRTSPWGKLYKKELIKSNHLFFDTNMCIGEDLVFLYEYIICSKTIYVTNQSDYYYNADRENSLTKKVNSMETEFLCMQKIIRTVDKLLKIKEINSLDALKFIERLKYTYIIRALNSLYHNNIPYNERIKRIKSINFHPLLCYLHNNAHTIKEKISYYLISLKFYRLYDFIRTLKKA